MKKTYIAILHCISIIIRKNIVCVEKCVCLEMYLTYENRNHLVLDLDLRPATLCVISFSTFSLSKQFLITVKFTSVPNDLPYLC